MTRNYQITTLTSMRITIHLDDDLLAEAKKVAAEERITLAALLERALQEMLVRGRQTRECPGAPLPSFKGIGLQPGVDLDCSSALLDLMETECSDMPGETMNQEDSPFIPGIYNYCDRWCERCRFTDRCEVYAREQQQWERHLLRGEDPDDPKVFLQDLTETLEETVQMLEQMAAEEGVDLDALPPPPERLRDTTAPLRVRAERWSDRVGALLERVRTDLPGIGADLAALAAALSDREEAERREALEGLKDAYEVLGHYQSLILVKTIRALGSRPSAEEESHPVLSEFAWDDSLGTAKLVHECLGKAAAALWGVGEFSQGWQDEALPLAAEAEGLRVVIDAEFPGHQEYRRHGLDHPVT